VPVHGLLRKRVVHQFVTRYWFGEGCKFHSAVNSVTTNEKSVGKLGDLFDEFDTCLLRKSHSVSKYS